MEGGGGGVWPFFDVVVPLFFVVFFLVVVFLNPNSWGGWVRGSARVVEVWSKGGVGDKRSPGRFLGFGNKPRPGLIS